MLHEVLLLDDDLDLLEALGDLISTVTSARCLTVRSLTELKARRAQALRCELAMLDINLGVGQPSGLDALAWLRAERFGGRVVFLTGHALQHPTVARACQMEGVSVLQKPIGLEQLRQSLAWTERPCATP